MPNVTLEIGPLWKMELLRDVLEERGVPAFVADANMKTIDPLLTGSLSFDARLEVPAEAVEEARRALAESIEEAAALRSTFEEEEPEPPKGAAADEIDDLGRRIRWAAVLFWMHPFVFVYGVRYLRAVTRAGERPSGHRLTVLALVVVGGLWGLLAMGVLRYGL